MRPAFNVPEYQAGFEYMRQALLQGLGQLPEDQGAQSWLIGAFCGVVRLVWEKRATGSGRVQVAAVLATVLADVLREAEGYPEDAAGEGGLVVLLEAFNAASVACAPRDSQGQALVDGEAVLQALATYAAQLLFTVEDRQMRNVRLAEFGTFVENVLDRLAERAKAGKPSGFVPVVLQGGLQ